MKNISGPPSTLIFKLSSLVMLFDLFIRDLWRVGGWVIGWVM